MEEVVIAINKLTQAVIGIGVSICVAIVINAWARD